MKQRKTFMSVKKIIREELHGFEDTLNSKEIIFNSVYLIVSEDEEYYFTGYRQGTEKRSNYREMYIVTVFTPEQDFFKFNVAKFDTIEKATQSVREIKHNGVFILRDADEIMEIEEFKPKIKEFLIMAKAVG